MLKTNRIRCPLKHNHSFLLTHSDPQKLRAFWLFLETLKPVFQLKSHETLMQAVAGAKENTENSNNTMPNARAAVDPSNIARELTALVVLPPFYPTPSRTVISSVNSQEDMVDSQCMSVDTEISSVDVRLRCRPSTSAARMPVPAIGAGCVVNRRGGQNTKRTITYPENSEGDEISVSPANKKRKGSEMNSSLRNLNWVDLFGN